MTIGDRTNLQLENIPPGPSSAFDERVEAPKKEGRQRFEILRKLGSGTYGKVSLATDHKTGEEVAVKIIKKSAIENEQDLLRIRREIRIMSALSHPNLIEIKEVFENKEKIIIIMEYASGGELYDYVSTRGSLEEDDARRIFRQIVSAVYYCHKHQVAHRDLKLENILLDKDYNAKIADFGLSNYFSDKGLLKTFCGSPLYASPEIINGTPYRGPEVDCWSLGVLLYTLVYGSMPFDGRDFNRMIRQIKRGAYYEPDMPSSASMLIRTMLRVNPARRATIDDIASHWWLNFTSENLIPIQDLEENQVIDSTPLIERKETMIVQALGDESEMFAEYTFLSLATRKKLEEFRRRRREVENVTPDGATPATKSRRRDSSCAGRSSCGTSRGTSRRSSRTKMESIDPLERLKAIEARLMGIVNQSQRSPSPDQSEAGPSVAAKTSSSRRSSISQGQDSPGTHKKRRSSVKVRVSSRDPTPLRNSQNASLATPSDFRQQSLAVTPPKMSSRTTAEPSLQSPDTERANDLMNQLLTASARGYIPQTLIDRIQCSDVYRTKPFMQEVLQSILTASTKKEAASRGGPSYPPQDVFLDHSMNPHEPIPTSETDELLNWRREDNLRETMDASTFRHEVPSAGASSNSTIRSDRLSKDVLPDLVNESENRQIAQHHREVSFKLDDDGDVVQLPIQVMSDSKPDIVTSSTERVEKFRSSAWQEAMTSAPIVDDEHHPMDSPSVSDSRQDEPPKVEQIYHDEDTEEEIEVDDDEIDEEQYEDEEESEEESNEIAMFSQREEEVCSISDFEDLEVEDDDDGHEEAAESMDEEEPIQLPVPGEEEVRTTSESGTSVSSEIISREIQVAEISELTTTKEPDTAPAVLENDDPFSRGLSKRLSRGKYEKSRHLIASRSISVDTSALLCRKKIGGAQPDPKDAEKLFNKAAQYILQYPDEQPSPPDRTNYLDPTVMFSPLPTLPEGKQPSVVQPSNGTTDDAQPTVSLTVEHRKEDEDEEEDEEDEEEESTSESRAILHSSKYVRILWPPAAAQQRQDVVAPSGHVNTVCVSATIAPPRPNSIAAPRTSTPPQTVSTAASVKAEFKLQPPPMPRKSRICSTPTSSENKSVAIPTSSAETNGCANVELPCITPSVNCSAPNSSALDSDDALYCERRRKSSPPVFTFPDTRIKSPEPTDTCRDRPLEPSLEQVLTRDSGKVAAIRCRRNRAKTTGFMENKLFHKAARLLTTGSTASSVATSSHTVIPDTSGPGTEMPAAEEMPENFLGDGGVSDIGEEVLSNGSSSRAHSKESLTEQHLYEEPLDSPYRRPSYRSAVDRTRTPTHSDSPADSGRTSPYSYESPASPGHVTYERPDITKRSDPFYSYTSKHSGTGHTDSSSTGVTGSIHARSNFRSPNYYSRPYAGFSDYVRPRYNNNIYRAGYLAKPTAAVQDEPRMSSSDRRKARSLHELTTDNPDLDERDSMTEKALSCDDKPEDLSADLSPSPCEGTPEPSETPSSYRHHIYTSAAGSDENIPPIPPRRRKARSMYDTTETTSQPRRYSEYGYGVGSSGLTAKYDSPWRQSPGSRYDHISGKTTLKYSSPSSESRYTSKNYRSPYDDNITYKRSYYDVERPEIHGVSAKGSIRERASRYLPTRDRGTTTARARSLEREKQSGRTGLYTNDRDYEAAIRPLSPPPPVERERTHLSYRYHDTSTGGHYRVGLKDPIKDFSSPLKGILKKSRYDGDRKESYFDKNSGLGGSSTLDYGDRGSSAYKSRPLRFMDKIRRHLSNDTTRSRPSGSSYKHDSGRGSSASSGYGSGGTAHDKENATTISLKKSSIYDDKSRSKRRGFLRMGKRSTSTGVGDKHNSSDSSGEDDRRKRRGSPGSPLDKIMGFFGSAKTKSKENLASPPCGGDGGSLHPAADTTPSNSTPTSSSRRSTDYTSYKESPTSYRSSGYTAPVTRHWYEDPSIY